MPRDRHSADRFFTMAQLLASGAVIGLYAAKAIGFTGIDVSPLSETAGAIVGAVLVLLLRAAHRV